jgi:hypothetical protein
MRLWDKSLRIFKSLCDHGQQGVRHIAQPTGLSKSRVPRLQHAMARRNSHPESWLWETAEGRHWLTRLVVATLYTFGLKRGVGLDTMSEFFARLHLERQVGCSPSALRGVMQALEAALLETAAAWEQAGCASGEVREVIGAVEETCLEHMGLGCMDLATGSLLLEEGADDRPSTPGKTLVEERLKGLGTGVLSGVSDRANALSQLAAQGLECLSMPDCFPVAREIVQSYALAIGQRWRHAQQELTQAKEALVRRQGLHHTEHATREARALVEARQAAMTRWEEGHHLYRGPLDSCSLTLPPCRLSGSMPQTCAQVESQLTAAGEAIDA